MLLATYLHDYLTHVFSQHASLSWIASFIWNYFWGFGITNFRQTRIRKTNHVSPWKHQVIPVLAVLVMSCWFVLHCCSVNDCNEALAIVMLILLSGVPCVTNTKTENKVSNKVNKGINILHDCLMLGQPNIRVILIQTINYSYNKVLSLPESIVLINLKVHQEWILPWEMTSIHSWQNSPHTIICGIIICH